MGRRFFLLLGMVLLLACGPARILGAQEPPAEPAPFEPLEASPLPPARETPPPVTERPAVAPFSALPRELPEEALTEQEAPRDEAVEPAQAKGAGAAADAGPGLPAVDRYPLGKHSVLVSVEVLAPSEMNLNKESKVRLLVANSGSSDAFDVIVQDDLPPGLKFVSSTETPESSEGGRLVWRLATLPAGSSKKIDMVVVPTSVSHIDHVASVIFRAGSKARTRVLEPRLKVEVVQSPSISKQLVGKPIEFRISITNTGDGPARSLLVLAKLSPGLAYDTGAKQNENALEHPIEGLGPGERIDLPALVVDTRQGGAQSCMVKVTSPDVEFNPADAEIERTVEVVEPKLKIEVAGPDTRYTQTIGDFAVVVENPGTAPARNVRVVATLPVNGQLVAVPSDATYDRSTKRLNWTIPELAPGEKPRSLAFQVRMLDVGFFEITSQAKAEGVGLLTQKHSTDVQGMSDLDVSVRENRRVVDVGNETTFIIILENLGTKEASNIVVQAELSENLKVTETSGGAEGASNRIKDKNVVIFPVIPRLGPSGQMKLGVKVHVQQLGDSIGTCRVYVKQADETTDHQAMANVKITEGRRSADAGGQSIR